MCSLASSCSTSYSPCRHCIRHKVGDVKRISSPFCSNTKTEIQCTVHPPISNSISPLIQLVTQVIPSRSITSTENKKSRYRKRLVRRRRRRRCRSQRFSIRSLLPRTLLSWHIPPYISYRHKRTSGKSKSLDRRRVNRVRKRYSASRQHQPNTSEKRLNFAKQGKTLTVKRNTAIRKRRVTVRRRVTHKTKKKNTSSSNKPVDMERLIGMVENLGNKNEVKSMKNHADYRNMNKQYPSEYCHCEMRSDIAKECYKYTDSSQTTCEQQTCGGEFICVEGNQKTKVICRRIGVQLSISPNGDGTCSKKLVRRYAPHITL